MAGLKPQDFAGLTGVDITVGNLAKKIIASVEARTDLSPELSNYLIMLTTECNKPNSVPANALKAAYVKAKNKDPSSINAVKKDFSELLGALLIKNETKTNISKLGLTVTASTKLNIPTAGNYPLVDFFLKTGTTVDKYSVKIMGKTTNTLKAHDVLSTVTNKVKNANKEETKLLEVISNNDAKLGPILALIQLAPTVTSIKKSDKLYSKFTSLSTAQQIKDTIGKNSIAWFNFLEPLMTQYYNTGKSTIKKVWNAGYHYDAITVLAQYAVAKITENMNWDEFVNDVYKQVTYFKFDLTEAGYPKYELVNGMSSKKPGQKFKLRAKSRLKESNPSSRSGQDKLGIQP